MNDRSVSSLISNISSSSTSPSVTGGSGGTSSLQSKLSAIKHLQSSLQSPSSTSSKSTSEDFISLNEGLMSKFALGKLFKNVCPSPSSSLNGLEFDRVEGRTLYSCSDDCIYLFDAVTGKPGIRNESHPLTHLPCKKYGVGLLKTSSLSPSSLFHTSARSEEGHKICLLSVHSNQYIKYFDGGHRNPISCFDVHPTDDFLLSVSANDALRLWDFRQGSTNLNVGYASLAAATPLIAFDPSGTIFVVALESRFLRLYDMKAWEKEPFAVFEICNPDHDEDDAGNGRGGPASVATWTQICFSPEGNDILISTTHSRHILVDSFDGKVKGVFRGGGSECSFTPDGKFVIGSAVANQRQQPSFFMWDRSNGRLLNSVYDDFEESQQPLSKLIKFNPKYCMLATVSGHCDVGMWILEDQINTK